MLFPIVAFSSLVACACLIECLLACLPVELFDCSIVRFLHAFVCLLDLIACLLVCFIVCSPVIVSVCPSEEFLKGAQF